MSRFKRLMIDLFGGDIKEDGGVKVEYLSNDTCSIRTMDDDRLYTFEDHGDEIIASHRGRKIVSFGYDLSAETLKSLRESA